MNKNRKCNSCACFLILSNDKYNDLLILFFLIFKLKYFDIYESLLSESQKKTFFLISPPLNLSLIYFRHDENCDDHSMKYSFHTSSKENLMLNIHNLIIIRNFPYKKQNIRANLGKKHHGSDLFLIISSPLRLEMVSAKIHEYRVDVIQRLRIRRIGRISCS